MATPDSSTTRSIGNLDDSLVRKNRNLIPKLVNTSMRNTFVDLNESLCNSSLFLSRCTPSTPRFRITKATDLTVINMETVADLMEELDGEILQLFRVEQQMQAIATKCRSLRENIDSKYSTIYTMVRQLAENGRRVFIPKETQTECVQTPIKPVIQKMSANETPVSFLHNTFRKRRLSSLSEKSNLSNAEPETEEEVSLKSNEVHKTNLNRQKLSDDLKMRFHRLPALVKGYLTRRLMKTEKVMKLVNTIKDINKSMDSIQHISTPLRKSDLSFMDYCTPYLRQSRQEIHEIFFKYTKAQQMSLIARKRQCVLELHYKNLVPISESSYIKYSSQENINKSGTSTELNKSIQKKANQSSKASANSSSKVNRSVFNSTTKTWEVSLGNLKSKGKSQSPAKKIMTRSALRLRNIKE